MKRSFIFSKSVAFALAVLLAAIMLGGCAASDSGSSPSKGLDADLTYAQARVSDFSHFEIRSAALFSEQAFSKANAAAMMASGRDSAEDFERIVRFLGLDSITVADENGVIVASYPDDETGKRLKDTTEKKGFSSIVSNNTTKQTTDPVETEDGSLSAHYENTVLITKGECEILTL